MSTIHTCYVVLKNAIRGKNRFHARYTIVFLINVCVIKENNFTTAIQKLLLLDLMDKMRNRYCKTRNRLIIFLRPLKTQLYFFILWVRIKKDCKQAYTFTIFIFYLYFQLYNFHILVTLKTLNRWFKILSCKYVLALLLVIVDFAENFFFVIYKINNNNEISIFSISLFLIFKMLE